MKKMWSKVLATVLVLAMVPYFLGLFLALPVLGHASWHVYRRIIAPLA